MQPYQEEYIENCRKYSSIISVPLIHGDDLEAFLDERVNDMREARQIARKNTLLIQEKLMPVLDSIHAQDKQTLDDLEKFADALTAAPLSLDVALACKIHEFLLSRYRYLKQREDIIRELYKLGMSRYGFWVLLTSLEIPEAEGFSLRMRFCFTEASSYLSFFDEFGEETKSYILRSLANTYLGNFSDWKEKFYRVKKTLQVFNDEKYHLSAPGLPWEHYIHTANRQMATSLPYSFPGGPPSPEIVTEVMESSLIIFERQVENEKNNGAAVQALEQMPYYTAEYNCGVLRKEDLLLHMERLMDEGDTSAYDDDNNYRIISMPAYYVQHLKFTPEMLPPREKYITTLYRRLLAYLREMPDDKISDKTLRCVWNDLACFYEVKDGVSYKELALEIMKRFSPELYLHGYTVGRMAQVMCGIIAENEPDHFNDIPGIAGLSSNAKKRAVIEDMAFNAGLLHDVGKLSFTPLYNHAGRQMLENEEEALELHAAAGYHRLIGHESCKDYVDAAYGHHMWYDGSYGYPSSFVRKESPYRALVDVIAFADYMDGEDDENVTLLPLRATSFNDKILEAKELEGRRFSPLVTGWLRMTELLIQLKDIYDNGRREGLGRLM